MSATNKSSITIKRLTDSVTLVPFATAKTGTVSTLGTKATGVGTFFIAEVPQNSILWNSAHEWRKALRIISDTEMVLDSAFTTPLSANAVMILPFNEQKSTETDVVFVGGDGVIVTTEEADIPAGLVVNLSKANRERSAEIDMVPCCVVDSTGTDAVITLIRFGV